MCHEVVSAAFLNRGGVVSSKQIFKTKLRRGYSNRHKIAHYAIMLQFIPWHSQLQCAMQLNATRDYCLDVLLVV